jgi:dihydrofolate reductase
MGKLTLIAAMSLNGVIGSDNAIPWNCPEDLKHFKDTTMGNVVIMGRKTFESLGSKPLPGRANIVITSKYIEGFQNNLYIVSDIKATMTLANRLGVPDKKIFIIGGGELYRQTIDIADKLIISHIHKPVKGNVKFPDINLEKWMVEKIDHRLSGDIPFSIIHYTK